jgi:hypothetical protein
LARQRLDSKRWVGILNDHKGLAFVGSLPQRKLFANALFATKHNRSESHPQFIPILRQHVAIGKCLAPFESKQKEEGAKDDAV